MADERFHIEPDGQHEYLFQAHPPSTADPVESRFIGSAAVLAELGVDGQDEQRVIEATAEFLAERQSVADFPALVDLDDVAAVYDGYYEALRQRLGS